MCKSGESLTATVRRWIQHWYQGFIILCREIIGYFSDIEIKENQLWVGDSDRYFCRYADYKNGGRPTIGGPDSYLLKVKAIRGKTVFYQSEVLVLDEQGGCEQDEINSMRPTSINQLKYEIKKGHLKAPGYDTKENDNGGENQGERM